MLNWVVTNTVYCVSAQVLLPLLSTCCYVHVLVIRHRMLDPRTRRPDLGKEREKATFRLCHKRQSRFEYGYFNMTWEENGLGVSKVGVWSDADNQTVSSSSSSSSSSFLVTFPAVGQYPQDEVNSCVKVPFPLRSFYLITCRV